MYNWKRKWANQLTRSKQDGQHIQNIKCTTSSQSSIALGGSSENELEKYMGKDRTGWESRRVITYTTRKNTQSSEITDPLKY